MNIRNLLSDHIHEAMLQVGLPAQFLPHVTPSKNPQFGDYQANGVMAAAKHSKCNPRELAQKIVDHVDLKGIAEKIDIAGPGFINIYLTNDWLAKSVSLAADDARLNIASKAKPQTVVVDYSSPNLAKEMHVGHIRTTVIGDALARILEFRGDRVLRQNHVGDWGTQFGMLIAELELHLSDGEQADLALKDLETFYQQAKKHFDEDPVFADTARDYVVKLQSGDARVLGLWEKFRAASLAHAEDIYRLLNVTLNREHVRGESAYNDALPALVEELKTLKLAREDEGAQVVFLEELADKDGNPSPVIVQKKDGGYLYATTDLAAMRYRSATLKADRIMYFIDDRQSLHMKQVFALARKAKLVPDQLSLEHHAFGKILGKDKKPFKTRSGDTVKLADLLNEAVQRAAEVVREKNALDQKLDEKEVAEIAEKVGIGAIKYADLSKTRTMDYVFDWEAMLSFEGNTGPYMQYAYTRICSIFRKAGISRQSHSAAIVISEVQEKALALKILQLGETLDQVADDAFPHVLCTYLYDLASLYMSFYEACPILKDEVSAINRASRLQLCKATANTLHIGLDLLGIDVMEKM